MEVANSKLRLITLKFKAESVHQVFPIFVPLPAKVNSLALIPLTISSPKRVI